MMDRLLIQIECPCSGGRSNPLLLLAMLIGTWLLIHGLRFVFRKAGAGAMNKTKKIAIITVLAVAVVAVIAARQSNSRPSTETGSAEQPAFVHPGELTGTGRPVLIDLGAGTCIPCKMMAPILADLKAEYAGAMDVHFLDVHENPDLITLYGIRVIPTQIFYDALGKEMFRHEGFLSKGDILTKWKELGVDLVSQP
jgi:thioredoxin 1